MVELWQKIERKLRKVRIFDEGFTFAAEMGKRSIATGAAGISFYFFVSIVPFFILLCSQLPYTGISSAELIEVITRFTPDNVDELVSSVIEEAYTSRIALFSLALLVLMWASAKVVTALIRSLDSIYQKQDNRNYFVITGRSLLYTASLLVISGGFLFIFAKGKNAEEFLLSLLSLNSIESSFVGIGQRTFGFVLSVLFFSLVYTIFPAGKRNYFSSIPGALVSETGIVIVTAFYAFHYSKRNVYTSFYGSLANLAISMMWIYTCIILFLLGAVFNKHFEEKINLRLNKIFKKGKINENRNKKGK